MFLPASLRCSGQCAEIKKEGNDAAKLSSEVHTLTKLGLLVLEICLSA